MLKRCPTCGNTDYEEKMVEYIYRHNGQYLIVENVPTEVCNVCQTRFYAAKVLQDIERQFFAIYRREQKPTRYVQVPVEIYGTV